MAQAISTQNQNVQLTKTFIVAFGAVLLAIPIITAITVAVVQAQFSGLAHAAQANQSNSLGTTGVQCAMPADEKQAVLDAQAAKSGGVWGRLFAWVPGVSQSNYYSESNSNSTTTTSTSTVDISNNGNTDNRWSGNTLGLSFNNGNTFAPTTNTTVNTVSNSGNTVNTDNSNNSVNNSGNTANSSASSTTNNVNTNVNSGNTIVNDNDGIDVL